jgi:hypothetical protein
VWPISVSDVDGPGPFEIEVNSTNVALEVDGRHLD